MPFGSLVVFFPFAGGAASFFKGYKERLEIAKINAICHEYKGHGVKYSEAFTESVMEDADEFIRRYSERLNQQKYILFGHSYGGVVVYEVCKMIVQKKIRMPLFVYLSSAALPADVNYIARDTSYEGIKRMMIANNLTTTSIIENSDFFDFFYPIVSNDIEKMNKYRPNVQKLGINARLFSGTDESLSGIERWDDVFNVLNHDKYEGNHGYIKAETNSRKLVNRLIDDFQ